MGSLVAPGYLDIWDPYERDCYLLNTLRIPKPTGPQTTNLPLVDQNKFLKHYIYIYASKLRHGRKEKQEKQSRIHTLDICA